MIGNSFSYYYADELYDMLERAGITANVSNIYYSGCTVQSHSAWLKNGAKNYQFVSHVDGGRTEVKGLSLTECLQQDEWDMKVR